LNSLSDFNVFFTILQCWKSEIASHDYQTIELPKPTGFRSFSKYFQSARQTSALAVCSEAPRPRNKKNEIRSEYGQVNFGPRLASFRVFVWKRPRHESSGRFLAFRLAAKVIGRRIRAARLASSWPFPGPQRTGLIRRSIERMALEFFLSVPGRIGPPECHSASPEYAGAHSLRGRRVGPERCRHAEEERRVPSRYRTGTQ